MLFYIKYYRRMVIWSPKFLVPFPKSRFSDLVWSPWQIFGFRAYLVWPPRLVPLVGLGWSPWVGPRWTNEVDRLTKPRSPKWNWFFLNPATSIKNSDVPRYNAFQNSERSKTGTSPIRRNLARLSERSKTRTLKITSIFLDCITSKTSLQKLYW